MRCSRYDEEAGNEAQRGRSCGRKVCKKGPERIPDKNKRKKREENGERHSS